MPPSRPALSSRSALALPACIVVALAAASPAHAELSLGPPVAKPTLDSPEGVVLADVDRDGFDDAIVGNRDDQAIQVFRGGPAGFGVPTAHETGANLPVAVAAGDLDGDGKLDLVSSAAVGGQNGEVAVLLGAGAGAFTAAAGSPFATTANGPATGSGIAVADITGDGHLDVLAGGDTELVLLPGDGTGALLAPVVTALSFSELRSIAVGDFVGDARPDVITGSEQPQTLSELYENVGGALTFDSLRDDTGNRVIAGDLDGTGRDDLVFTRLSGDEVGTLLSTGDGTFSAEPQITEAAMFFVSGMALADVDADGRNDVAVGGADFVELFAGAGPAGAFAGFPGSPVATTGFNRDVALGDATGDGQPDLVYTTGEADTITLVANLNTSAASGPAGVDFGASPAGGPAVERTVTLTSGGPGFYRAKSAAISPAGTGIAITADACSGRSLVVGATCAITLRFTPGAAAGATAASLTIAENTAAGTRSIPLTASVAGGPPTAPDTTRPTVGKVRLSRTSFAVGKRATAKLAAARKPKRGTKIRFTLSEPARVTLTFERRKGKRFAKVGTITRRAGRRGANTVAFTGRIGKKALRTGRYRVAVRAVDAAGNRSATPARAPFRVVKGR